MIAPLPIARTDYLARIAAADAIRTARARLRRRGSTFPHADVNAATLFVAAGIATNCEDETVAAAIRAVLTNPAPAVS